MEKYEHEEITEAEATSRLAKMIVEAQAEFERRASEEQSVDMQRAALIMSSRPVTCIPAGAVVNCF